MSVREDGGRAFPLPFDRNEYGEQMFTLEMGLTVRDYFAAKAMQAVIGAPDGHPVSGRHDIASRAYEMADAMIAARSRP